MRDGGLRKILRAIFNCGSTQPSSTISPAYQGGGEGRWHLELAGILESYHNRPNLLGHSFAVIDDFLVAKSENSNIMSFNVPLSYLIFLQCARNFMTFAIGFDR